MPKVTYIPLVDSRPGSDMTEAQMVKIVNETKSVVIGHQPGDCPCGCGEVAKGKDRKFVAGHDARLKGILIRAHVHGVNIVTVTDGAQVENTALAVAKTYGWESYLIAAKTKADAKAKAAAERASNAEKAKAERLAKREAATAVKKAEREKVAKEKADAKAKAKQEREQAAKVKKEQAAKTAAEKAAAKKAAAAKAAKAKAEKDAQDAQGAETVEASK